MKEPACISVVVATPAEAQACARRHIVSLSLADRERLRGMTDSEQAKAFVDRRHLLYKIVEWHSGIPAPDLALDYDRYGKPWINARSGSRRVAVNVSYCADLILVAVADGSLVERVGVDIEAMDGGIDAEGVLNTFFKGMAVSRRRCAIDYDPLQTLVQIEALCKAGGRGLASALGTNGERRRYSVRRINLGGAFRAAVAGCGSRWGVTVTGITSVVV